MDLTNTQTTQKQTATMPILRDPGVILVPDKWNDDLDREDYDDRFGVPESSDYVLIDLAMNKVIECFQQSSEMLDYALRFFLRRAGNSMSDCGQALPAQEKIDWLHDLVVVADLTEGVKSRFLRDLAQCHWAESERRRVMRYYQEPARKKWAAPLCQLADCLFTAVWDFDESLYCEDETEGYKSVWHSGIFCPERD